MPLAKIVQAHRARVASRHELAEYLGVTEEFLQSALTRYKEKYGPYKTIGQYTIRFEPLGVLEMLED